MARGALLFATHLREARAQQIFLAFLFSDEFLQRRRVHEPDPGDTLSGNRTVAREARDIIEDEIDGACGVARPDVGHAIEDHLA